IETVRSGQIALAFPQAGPAAPPYPHLDGLPTPTNGVPAGEVRSFTLLVGIVLSDVAAPGAGNLTVWPGSHRLYEAHFREPGPRRPALGVPDGSVAGVAGPQGTATVKATSEVPFLHHPSRLEQ